MIFAAGIAGAPHGASHPLGDPTRDHRVWATELWDVGRAQRSGLSGLSRAVTSPVLALRRGSATQERHHTSPASAGLFWGILSIPGPRRKLHPPLPVATVCVSAA